MCEYVISKYTYIHIIYHAQIKKTHISYVHVRDISYTYMCVFPTPSNTYIGLFGCSVSITWMLHLFHIQR